MADVISIDAARARRRPAADPSPFREGFIDKRALARHFNRSTRTIERWAREGMPAHRPFERSWPLFRVAECERWLDERRGGAA